MAVMMYTQISRHVQAVRTALSHWHWAWSLITLPSCRANTAQQHAHAQLLMEQNTYAGVSYLL